MENITISYKLLKECGNATILYDQLQHFNSPFTFYYNNDDSYNRVNITPNIVMLKNDIFTNNEKNIKKYFRQTQLTHTQLDWSRIFQDCIISDIRDHGDGIATYVCIKLSPKLANDLFLINQLIHKETISIYSVMFRTNYNGCANLDLIHEDYLKMNKKNINNTIYCLARDFMMHLPKYDKKEFNLMIQNIVAKITPVDNNKYYLQFINNSLDHTTCKSILRKVNIKFEFRRFLEFNNYAITYPLNIDSNGNKVAEQTSVFAYERNEVKQTLHYNNISKDINIHLVATQVLENEVTIPLDSSGFVCYELSGYLKTGELICFTAKQSIAQMKNIKDEFKLSYDAFTANANIFSIEYLYELTNDARIEINFAFDYLELSDNNYTNIAEKIKKATHFRGNNPKEMCAKAIGLGKINYTKIFKQVDYFISKKTDGTHALIYFDIGDADKITVEAITDEREFKFIGDRGDAMKSGKYIFECEYLDNSSFIIFDIFMFESEDLLPLNTGERIEYIEPAVKLLNKLGVSSFGKTWIKIPKSANSQEIKATYAELDAQKVEYEDDGIILMTDAMYMDCEVYKWKPLEHLTIDFYVKKVYRIDDSRNMYWLMCGMTSDDFYNYNKRLPPDYLKYFNNNKAKFFPFPFMPAEKPDKYKFIATNKELGNGESIFEFAYIDGKFKPTRERIDRKINLDGGLYYGNFWRIAELNWLGIINPLNKADLWNFEELEGNRYFHKKDERYEKQTKYSKRAKEYIMAMPQGSNNNVCLDIGFGKGQDLFRYGLMKTRELFCVEPDTDAITVARDNYLTWRDRKATLPNIHTINSDISNIDFVCANITSMIDISYGINANKSIINKLVMNFSVHYYIHNIGEIVEKLSPFMAPNSHIICVFLNGSKVFNKLADKSEIVFTEANKMKYKIVKKYTESELLQNGQRVELLLPFSDGELYSEQLVNPKYLNEEISKNGYKLIISKPINHESFAQIFDKREALNRLRIFFELSDADKEWINLYSFAIWKKN